MKTDDIDDYYQPETNKSSNTSAKKKKKDFVPLESVSEIDQYIAAQNLIAEISHQFATNKSMLESWFISSTVEEFKVSLIDRCFCGDLSLIFILIRN